MKLRFTQMDDNGINLFSGQLPMPQAAPRIMKMYFQGKIQNTSR